MNYPFDLKSEIELLFLTDQEYEEYIKKKETWNSSFTENEKLQNEFDINKSDIIELVTFKEIEHDIIKEQKNENEKEINEKKEEIKSVDKVEFKLGEEDFINPDIFTPNELQLIFCIIPLEIVTERITNISNKVYKIKGLKAFVVDKHIYNTLIMFNEEMHKELKSELAISFAKLILSKIPNKYITVL